MTKSHEKQRHQKKIHKTQTIRIITIIQLFPLFFVPALELIFLLVITALLKQLCKHLIKSVDINIITQKIILKLSLNIFDVFLRGEILNMKHYKYIVFFTCLLLCAGVTFAAGVDESSTYSDNTGQVEIQHSTGIEKYETTQKTGDSNSAGGIVKNNNISSEASKNANQSEVLKTRDIYVKSNANDSEADGTLQKPYATVELAVSKAGTGYNNVIHLNAGTYKLSNRITLTKNVTLVGDNRNRTIIDCNNIQAFRVRSNVTFTLENLTIQNANYSQGGVIVLSDSSKLVINGCNFKKNRANNGGVLFASANNITADITNSLFDSNTAIRFGAALQMGGYNSIYTIVNSTFINNKLTDKDYSHSTGGAAIYASSYSTVNIDNCVFKNNEAIWGCAVLIGNHANLTLENSNFTGNVAVKNTEGYNRTKGGALAVGSGYVEIIKCNFENNKADIGGAISINSGEATLISSCTFKKNIAYHEAGAINNYGLLTLKNTTFIKNSADIVGGALLDKGLTNVMVDNCTFKNNRVMTTKLANGSVPCGGAIFIVSAVPHFTIKNSVFDHNSAYWGGAIFSHRKVQWITLTGNRFNNNTACYGGAVYIMGESMMDVDKSIFTYNHAIKNGGVMEVTAEAQVNFATSKFSKNAVNQSREGNGGVVSLDSYSRVGFDNCHFDNNVASQNGGVIYASTSVNVRITSSNMTKNTASTGSVVFLNNTNTYKKVNSQIIIDTSTFANNRGKYVLYSDREYDEASNYNLIRTSWWGSNKVPSDVTHNFRLLNYPILTIKLNDALIDVDWIKNDVALVVNRTANAAKNLLISLTTIKENDSLRYTDAFLPARLMTIKENNKERKTDFYVYEIIDKSLDTIAVTLDNQKIKITLVS